MPLPCNVDIKGNVSNEQKYQLGHQVCVKVFLSAYVKGINQAHITFFLLLHGPIAYKVLVTRGGF